MDSPVNDRLPGLVDILQLHLGNVFFLFLDVSAVGDRQTSDMEEIFISGTIAGLSAVSSLMTR